MSDAFDLAGYLGRIDYRGSQKPTVDTLKAIHAKHSAAIPFENLDPLLGRPVNLDLPSLQAKLVKQRRGGYCFEQNSLFASALDALGFKVTRLGARVRWNAPPDRPEGPRSHMLLRVGHRRRAVPRRCRLWRLHPIGAAEADARPGADGRGQRSAPRREGRRLRAPATPHGRLERRVSLRHDAAIAVRLRSVELVDIDASDGDLYRQPACRTADARRALQRVQQAADDAICGRANRGAERSRTPANSRTY